MVYLNPFENFVEKQDQNKGKGKENIKTDFYLKTFFVNKTS